MKYDYYMHRSGGFINDYFGYVGDPFKVCWFKYWFFGTCGYKVTRVPKNSTMKVILTQSLINAEIHLESHAAEELFKKHKADK